MQFLSALSLHAVSHFRIPELVPLDGEISYAELSAKTGVGLVALRQLLRQATTNKIFQESSKNHISHTSTSRLLVENKKLAALIGYFTDTLKLAAAHECDALERWPNSLSPRETGYSIGVGNGGQTSFYEELQKDVKQKDRFSNAMEVWATGDAYKIDTLVEEYDWGRLGSGTVVDVSGPLTLQAISVPSSHMEKFSSSCRVF